MERQLEQALLSIDPLPAQDTGIVGTWTLENAPQLGADALNSIAHQTGAYDPLDTFYRRFTASPEKPREPDPDDPSFRPPSDQSYPPELIAKHGLKKIRLVETAQNLNTARNAYKNALQTYNTETANAHYVRSNFGHSVYGYLGYAHAQVSRMAQEQDRPELLAALDRFSKKKRSLPIAEKTARLGTFIVGNHGSGKSEVIKHRIWHYLTKSNPHETVVLIDPHGELAHEVARMKPNLDSDRLVFFDPLLMPGFAPCMSILNTANKHPDNLRFESRIYGSALEMISGGEMSENMQSLCDRCAHIVLEGDQYSILDLMKLVNVAPPKRGQPEKPNPPIYNFACQRSANFIIRDFFRENFLYGNFGQAKNGLYERITRVVTSPIVQRMFLNPPTLDFQTLVNEGKVIVISLPMQRLGDDVTRMIGQMIVAQIQLAVLKRDLTRIERYPQVHLFMDEAHHFVSPQTAKQIDELRKFRLSLTLATQYVDKFPKTILESVRGLGVQIAGYCAGDNLAEMNTVFDLKRGATRDNDVDERTILNKLPVGNFYFKTRSAAGMPALKNRQFSTDTTLLYNEAKWRTQNAERYMSDGEWEACKQAQIAQYYARIDDQAPIEVIEEDGRFESRDREDISREFATIIQPQRGYD